MADAFDAFPDAPPELAGRFAQPKLTGGADPFADFPDAPNPVGKLDFSRPDADIRAAIARLPEGERTQAQNAWAAQRVKRLTDKAGVPRPFYGEGIPVLGAVVDELGAGLNAAGHYLTGGAVGRPYDEALAETRALSRAADAARPAEALAGKIATGIVTGGPALSRIPAAKTTMGSITQGATVGGGLGAIEGYGRGEGDVESRLDSSILGALLGGGLGVAIPAGVAAVGKGIDLASPQLARVGQIARNQAMDLGLLPQARPPSSVGAAASPPTSLPPITGADAAADQMIANQLARANLSMTDVRQRMAQARQALNVGQIQPNAAALVDVDPSLQRLAGSVQRQQPEAGNIARTFIAGRQTGITPREGMPPNSGLPTRGMLETPAPGSPPMGQAERVRDGLRAALNVPPSSAHRTEQQMLAEAKKEANRFYGDANRAASGIDVSQHIQPVLDRWLARAADEPREIARAIQQAAALFRAPSGTVRTLPRFQASKEYLDGKIETLMDSLTGRNRRLGGLLSEMQRDLLGAVDGIQANGVGQLYATARGAFGSRAQMREAIEMGRQALREGSEVSADVYAGLSSGQQRLFRLGLFSDLDQQIARARRGNDVTLIFDSPRVQELLTAIMPPDRAQRLGRFLQNEKSFISTRNEVLGNSKTAERLADDEAASQMVGMLDQVRQSRSIREAAFDATAAVITRLFGFRADTAAAVARRLFTADLGEIETILQQLEKRLGDGRAAQFRKLMTDHYARMLQGSTVGSQVGSQTGGPQPQVQ